jgi:hypothetical protein
MGRSAKPGIFDVPRLTEGRRVAALADAYRKQLDVHIDLPEPALDYVLCTQCDLRFFSPPITGSEQFYAQLQKIRWYYSAAKQEFGIAAAHVKPEDDVLEIGAGRGLFSREIRCRSYTGLEFSPDAIRWAAEDGLRLLPRTIEEHSRTAGGEYDVWQNRASCAGSRTARVLPSAS